MVKNHLSLPKDIAVVLQEFMDVKNFKQAKRLIERHKESVGDQYEKTLAYIESYSKNIVKI